MKQLAPLGKPILAHIIRHAPLVSIDLIVHNSLGEVLLGKRSNAPARQMWFVPGGRIHKGERIPQALERVILEELGPQEPPQEVNFHGIFDHMYEENVFGYPEFGTHYVVLAHRIIMDLSLGSLPDGQHQEYRWWSIDQMLASPLVHSYTQAYFC